MSGRVLLKSSGSNPNDPRDTVPQKTFPHSTQFWEGSNCALVLESSLSSGFTLKIFPVWFGTTIVSSASNLLASSTANSLMFKLTSLPVARRLVTGQRLATICRQTSQRYYAQMPPNGPPGGQGGGFPGFQFNQAPQKGEALKEFVCVSAH